MQETQGPQGSHGSSESRGLPPDKEWLPSSLKDSSKRVSSYVLAMFSSPISLGEIIYKRLSSSTVHKNSKEEAEQKTEELATPIVLGKAMKPSEEMAVKSKKEVFIGEGKDRDEKPNKDKLIDEKIALEKEWKEKGLTLKTPAGLRTIKLEKEELTSKITNLEARINGSQAPDSSTTHNDKIELARARILLYKTNKKIERIESGVTRGLEVHRRLDEIAGKLNKIKEEENLF